MKTAKHAAIVALIGLIIAALMPASVAGDIAIGLFAASATVAWQARRPRVAYARARRNRRF